MGKDLALSLPTFDDLFNPLIRALRALGGSGSIQEIYDKVVELEKLPESVLSQLHNEGDMTEVAYRLAWARSWLKKFGVLENSQRGVWSLTAQARDLEEVNPVEVLRSVRSSFKKNIAKKAETRTPRKAPEDLLQEEESGDDAWKLQLTGILTNLAPKAFERLTQRMLRELGFTQVEVTGRTGDGGIDGRGIARLNGVMSFHALFQCKRYKGSVGAGEVRDFRGAMVGRADKGLFLTTGIFTPAAVKEATRDGAPPIDLIDGDAFAELLKQLGLGVRRELVETIRVDEQWFAGI